MYGLWTVQLVAPFPFYMTCQIKLLLHSKLAHKENYIFYVLEFFFPGIHIFELNQL